MNRIIFFLLVTFLINPLQAQYDTIKTYYNDGTIETIIPTRKNIREGAARFYYPNGNLKEERLYKNGKIEGLVKIYYENGILKESYNLEGGKRQGPAAYFDSSGLFLSEIMYDAGLPVKEEFSEDEEKDFTEGGILSPVTPLTSPIEAMLEIDSTYYTIADTMPEPVEGWKHFEDILYYPDAAIQNRIEGVVKIKALVNERGEVEKTEIIQQLGYGCEHAADIMVYYAKFKPGIRKGKRVPVEMVIDVVFKLPK